MYDIAQHQSSTGNWPLPEVVAEAGAHSVLEIGIRCKVTPRRPVAAETPARVAAHRRRNNRLVGRHCTAVATYQFCHAARLLSEFSDSQNH